LVTVALGGDAGTNLPKGHLAETLEKELKNVLETENREGFRMEIFIGHVSSFETGTSEIGSVSRKKMMTRNNRRKRKHDRRRSVREGIFVLLSVKNDRRVVRDRRQGVP
jgi:hypothetical protein